MRASSARGNADLRANSVKMAKARLREATPYIEVLTGRRRGYYFDMLDFLRAFKFKATPSPTAWFPHSTYDRADQKSNFDIPVGMIRMTCAGRSMRYADAFVHPVVILFPPCAYSARVFKSAHFGPVYNRDTSCILMTECWSCEESGCIVDIALAKHLSRSSDLSEWKAAPFSLEA